MTRDDAECVAFLVCGLLVILLAVILTPATSAT